MSRPLVLCTQCAGSGTVPHVKRRLGGDSGAPVDPHDHQTIEICQRCGGGGKMVSPPPSGG